MRSRPIPGRAPRPKPGGANDGGSSWSYAFLLSGPLTSNGDAMRRPEMEHGRKHLPQKRLKRAQTRGSESGFGAFTAGRRYSGAPIFRNGGRVLIFGGGASAR